MTAWVGADFELGISIAAAYRVGLGKASQRFLWDVVAKFLQWAVKSSVIESYWEQLEVIFSGSKVSIYPDLSSVTLKKGKIKRFKQKISKDGRSHINGVSYLGC